MKEHSCGWLEYSGAVTVEYVEDRHGGYWTLAGEGEVEWICEILFCPFCGTQLTPGG